MKPRILEPRHAFEVIDVELGHVFYGDNATDAEETRIAIERRGHHAVLKEVKS